MKVDNVLELIGNTPVVRLRALAPEHVRLYVKLESMNPMSSVKDRLALGVIEAAERSGELRPGQTVIEATSGNTGIGLAMVCAQKGYPLVIVMSESFSVERRRLMRFLGAKVVLTPAHLRGVGMMKKTVELAERHGWFFTRQFENEANADMHSRTTAEEILTDFPPEAEPLDHWVTGYGTGGTLKGVARVLRARSPRTEIVVCEADNSPVLKSGLPNPKNPDGTSASHPMARPHPMQGWGPDFIPKLTEDVVRDRLFDRIMPVNGGDALRLSRELARKEGIFVGASAGGTLAGALEVARAAKPGATILCMLPDTGERYLSTPLFADVGIEMNEEELAISRSTPSARFDAPATATPVVANEAPVVAPEARRFVDEVLADRQQPVVLFALEWCEFCWAVRRLFQACSVPYRSVDLDSVAYQADDRGGKIRTAVSARSGMGTIPQIFVGGELIGGAIDVLESWKQGTVQERLDRLGVSYDRARMVEPKTFLPTWLAAR
jgi:cysteine synthase A